MTASRARLQWRGLICLLGWACACAVLAADIQAHPQALDALEVVPLPEGGDVRPGWRSDGPLPPAQTVALELGDAIEGGTLLLHPARPGGTWRVQVQFETSLSLGAGGPHLDLTEWKHCVSDWTSAEALDAHAFVLPVASPDDQACFPEYTRDELEAAVRAHLADDPEKVARWLDGLDAPPEQAEVVPAVGISAIRVRVEILQAGRWVEVTRVTFEPPMGC
ncbi:hypothetical protein [Luteimonas deserti]|uniref:Uncharacterized protein n=1 Tax=Luteimonas deserti TaxID=2752306 RepID=A0A7Z0QSF9_9GAMM|nr:hypothetical protein [Luteimonas deserti]NYZ62940.1 hypothetical protein [Luteimonas deserti]